MLRCIGFDSLTQLLPISTDRFIEKAMQIGKELPTSSFGTKVCSAELVESLLNVLRVGLVMFKQVPSSHDSLFDDIDQANRAFEIGLRLSKQILINDLELFCNLIPLAIFCRIVNGSLFNCIPQNSKHVSACSACILLYPTQSHEMLFDAHTRSFAALGGIPRRGIYDNMKTAVDKVKKGKGRIVNARFAVMCAHYLFDPDFCNVASGWEKGVVEKNVQDSRRRIWLEAQTRKFGTFAELNAWLGERCRSLWSEVRHPEYTQFSVADMLEQERAEMMPMPTPFDGYVEKEARVSSTCLVRVARNRYSVPCEFAGQRVSTRLYPDRVCIVASDAMVASHERLTCRDEIHYDWQHYIPLVQRKPGALRNGAPFADMPAPLKQLRLGLLRHAGGDRVMAQVLAAVPSAGLDAVLVAVELVIESGALSAEHVENVLARLNASPPPACVETSLQLKEAPLANTSRYDSLRGMDETVADAVEVDHEA